METALTAAACIAEASRSGGELFLHTDRIRTQVDERSRLIQRARSDAQLARTIAALRSTMAPLVRLVLEKAEEGVRLVRLGLRLQDALNNDERLWQVALLILETNRDLVEKACTPLRRLARRGNRTVRGIWPTAWEERYQAALESLEDLSETIALGLNADSRLEIEEARRALPASA